MQHHLSEQTGKKQMQAGKPSISACGKGIGNVVQSGCGEQQPGLLPGGIKQDLRFIQKTIYFAFFTDNIWSFLLWPHEIAPF